ncbi:uncharacterized protein LOC126410016 [Nymphaea colorata]|nr:uncharacterized protein LOC126410016 [Nymphaea colorata]
MEISSVWNELDQLTPKLGLDCKCHEIRREEIDEFRFFQFLQGLRPEFEQIRSALLSLASPPPIHELLTKLSGEETRMKLSKELDSVLISKQEEKVLAASRPGNNIKSFRPPHFKNQNRGEFKVVCHFCHEPGHIKPSCPKLNNNEGQPRNYGGNLFKGGASYPQGGQHNRGSGTSYSQGGQYNNRQFDQRRVANVANEGCDLSSISTTLNQIMSVLQPMIKESNPGALATTASTSNTPGSPNREIDWGRF